MRKKLVFGIVMSMVSISTFAGGLLTNTNQNAVFLRNPARDAVIAIDGVYSNPAGVAFLPKGLHLSLSWQAAWQTRQMNVANDLFLANGGSANKVFEGKAAAPVVPSFQLAYVFNDKWSVSAQFAVGGGGGACEFAQGLPMFEELVGGSIMTAGTGATSYSLNQSLTGKQYFYGLQLGATYRITENLSVFGGVRGVLASAAYEGFIKDIKASGVAAKDYYGGLMTQVTDGLAQINAGLPQISAGLQQLEPVKDVPGYKEQYDALVAQQAALTAKKAELEASQGKLQQALGLLGNDFNLDCQQSGFGITPIIGVNWNLGKWNLAAKYEFRTKIELKNDSKNTSANVTALMPAYADGAKVRSDIPALLTVGAQYSPIEAVRINGGFHYYWDKQAQGTAIVEGKNTWEAALGVEWDINDKFLVSVGTQRTQYGFADADMKDTNYNINSTALCVGGAYKFSKDIKLNFGYMHSFYGNHEFTNANKTVCDYTRKSDAVGISLDMRF